VDVTEVDGRRLRREANRDAVLDALAQLWDEGHFDPSAAEVAVRAGLSPRSLFRYFDDADDLHHATIDHVLARVAHLSGVEASPRDPTSAKVAALLAARERLFGALGSAAHAARVVAHRAPLVAARIATTRRQLRAQITHVFAPELAHARHGTLELLDILTGFETWELRRALPHARRAAADRRLAETLVDLLSKESP
jgi:AcrR family transcriptional regulator